MWDWICDVHAGDWVQAAATLLAGLLAAGIAVSALRKQGAETDRSIRAQGESTDRSIESQGQLTRASIDAGYTQMRVGRQMDAGERLIVGAAECFRHLRLMDGPLHARTRDNTLSGIDDPWMHARADDFAKLYSSIYTLTNVWQVHQGSRAVADAAIQFANAANAAHEDIKDYYRRSNANPSTERAQLKPAEAAYGRLLVVAGNEFDASLTAEPPVETTMQLDD
jgi:hypothetical protein